MSRLFYRWRIVRIVSSHVLVLYAPIILAGDPTPIPPQTVQLLSRYCLDCHDAETEKGDINLEHAAIDWSDPKAATCGNAS